MYKWQYQLEIIMCPYILKIQLMWFDKYLIFKHLPTINKILLITKLWFY